MIWVPDQKIFSSEEFIIQILPGVDFLFIDSWAQSFLELWTVKVNFLVKKLVAVVLDYLYFQEIHTRGIL
jgi:hypothetical protein